MTSEIVFEKATLDSVRAFAGAPPPVTFIGWAAKRGQDVLGLFGIYYENGRTIAFAEIADEGRRYRKAILRGGRILLDFMNLLDRPIFAIPKPGVESAMRYLVYLGFRPTGAVTPLGEIFVRTPSCSKN